MKKLRRFGISMPAELLERFDEYIRNRKYTNRSKAIVDLINKEFISDESKKPNSFIAGAITIVYNHHKRELLDRITDLQHSYGDIIISSQHIHLNHDNCLEIIAVKGRYKRIKELADGLGSVKGVYHKTLSVSLSCKK